MASKIPVIDLPSVSQQPAHPVAGGPLATTTAEGYGGGVGKEILNEAVPAEIAVQDAADRERVVVEMKRLAEYKQNSVDDPQNGVLARRNMNAKGISEQVGKDLDALEQQIKGGLQNGNQRKIFDAEFAPQKFGLLAVVSHHEIGQVEAAGKQAFTDRLKELSSDMSRAASYGMPLDDSIKAIVREVNDRAPLEGWGADQVKSEVRKALGDAHTGAVLSLVGQNKYTDANAYLAKYRDQMDPKVWGEAMSHVQQSQRSYHDMGLALTTWNQIADFDPLSHNFNEERTREFFDGLPPDVQQATREEIDRRITAQRHIQEEMHKDRQGRLEVKIHNGMPLKALESDQDYAFLDDHWKGIVRDRFDTYQRTLASASAQDRAIQHEEDREATANFRARLTDVEGPSRTEALAWSRKDLAAKYSHASDTALDNMLVEKNKIIRMYQTASGKDFQKIAEDLRNGFGASSSDQAKRAVDELTSWWINNTQDPANPPKKEDLAAKAAEIGAVYYRKIGNTNLPFTVRGVDLTPAERAARTRADDDKQKLDLARQKPRGGPDQTTSAAPAPNSSRVLNAKKRLAPGQVLVLRDGVLGGVDPSNVTSTDVRY